MKRLFSLIFFTVAVFSSAALTAAQGTATLTGTVSDPQGGTVPGANVTATNVATNISSRTQTTGDGLYRFPTLPVGAYKLSVETSGFKTAQLENIILTV